MRIYTLLILVLAIMAAWIVTPLIAKLIVGDLNSAGSLGDSFGSVNALFSGLAFAGVICAIIMQRQELALQREELSLTREELRKSAEAQQQSSDKLAEQAEVMKVTAHLNGLSTLIQATSVQIDHLKSTNKPPNRHISEEIERLLKLQKDQTGELDSLMHSIRCAAEYPYR
jgi:methyl-accepting chemotaxis protein